MCRLLAYLGPTISLDTLLMQPEHSLVVQSYQPREMTSGLLNADGFGLGWYAQHPDQPPFIYRNTAPIWSDSNLEELSRYIASGCILANVRSATPGQAVQLSNCQPFRFGRWLGIHNGYIENFQHTLLRPIRDRLSDPCYRLIQGTTDSEHLFALFCQQLLDSPGISLGQALQQTLKIILELAVKLEIRVGLNLIVGDGDALVASRCAYPSPAPSLYWLDHVPDFASSILIASEPIFPSDRWHSCPESTILSIGADLDIQTIQL